MNETEDAIHAVLDGAVLRERLWMIFTPEAATRRTLMLIDHAMRVLREESGALEATLVTPVLSEPLTVTSAA